MPQPELRQEPASDPVQALRRFRAGGADSVATLAGTADEKMRKAVGKDNMPDQLHAVNGKPILEEEFADNAFAYASIQVMKPGERDDDWHTDGGCSLLHASVTLFGTRTVQVRMAGAEDIDLAQEPGSFYVGNLCALSHNVHHHAECLRTFDPEAETAQGHGEAATANRGLQIAVMIRSDVFRNVKARKTNSTPSPKQFFRVVNRAVAEHLAECPVSLPDLTAVLAEASRADLVSGGLTD